MGKLFGLYFFQNIVKICYSNLNTGQHHMAFPVIRVLVLLKLVILVVQFNAGHLKHVL